MTTKHTPGPWTCEREFTPEGVQKETAGKCGVEIQSNGYHIGTWVDNEWDGHCPNARLIAAAPELLEALRGMIEWARRVHERNPGMEVANAVIAIAKAEGR